MRRREFIALVGASAAAWPLSTSAQQVQSKRPLGRPALIAALVPQTKAQSDLDKLGPFRKGMEKLGYLEGRDYIIEARYADGDATRYPSMAKELVSLTPDLILVTGSGPPGAAVQQATATIPIVVGNLSAADLDLLIGKNLAHPAGNVTGNTTDVATLPGKHCDLALEIVPGAKRIGALIYSLNTDGGALARQIIETAATVRKFTPVMVDVAVPTDIAPAFRLLAAERVDAIVVGGGIVFAADRQLTAAGAAAVRLPAVYNEQGYVEAGGLISYGFDSRATFAAAATYAARILEGAKPAELPVEQTSTYLMAINLKTAKTLGLTIPPTVMFRADIVIE